MDNNEQSTVNFTFSYYIFKYICAFARSLWCFRVPTGITVDKYVEFFYDELAKATDDFSIANKIGQGGFGAVYYAELRGEVCSY